MRIAALSIDLDSLDCYRRLHGLAPAADGPDPVYGKAVERFADLCARLRIRATAFAIGSRLSDPGAAEAVRRLAGAGHEVANHSYSHDYALSRRAPGLIALEVRRGAEAVAAATGSVPVGFRAPGYAISAPLLRELAEQGYRYDSSAFPSAPYWLAKASAMAAMALAGRPTEAIVERPRALAAPRVPYRPSAREPYARGDLPILELPVSTGLFGFPLVGTFIATLPERATRILAAGSGSLPLFNLELHGIDFLDASDASAELAARQPDLRVPAAGKIARIESFARGLGREWLPLCEVAARLP